MRVATHHQSGGPRGAAAAWLAAGLLGCAVGGPLGQDCDTGADCESGACRDRVCVDPGVPEGGGGQAAASTTTSGSGAGGGGAGGGTVVCSPNNDGTITRDEVPIQVGLSAKFLSAVDAPVSTAGATVDGVRVWDLAGPLAGDQLSLLETMSLASSWYGPVYPGATYAARLSQTETLLGVFEVTPAALLLRGVVSPEDGVGRTELTYSTPVPVLAFPLEVGSAWSTDSTVSGLAGGIFSTYLEEYDVIVDARGELTTPFATFDVLRVRVDLTRWLGAFPTTTRTYVFVTECFGSVATVVSQPNEPSVEFTSAAEVRRLSP